MQSYYACPAQELSRKVVSLHLGVYEFERVKLHSARRCTVAHCTRMSGIRRHTFQCLGYTFPHT